MVHSLLLPFLFFFKGAIKIDLDGYFCNLVPPRVCHGTKYTPESFMIGSCPNSISTPYFLLTTNDQSSTSVPLSPQH